MQVLARNIKPGMVTTAHGVIAEVESETNTLRGVEEEQSTTYDLFDSGVEVTDKCFAPARHDGHWGGFRSFTDQNSDEPVYLTSFAKAEKMVLDGMTRGGSHFSLCQITSPQERVEYRMLDNGRVRRLKNGRIKMFQTDAPDTVIMSVEEFFSAVARSAR